jgi:hypothetical protein
MGVLGVAPTLTKDGKLFADIEAKTEADERNEMKVSDGKFLKR